MHTDKQEKIFKNWLNEYKGLVFKIVRAYAVSAQDQDDLFQDILLQLWSSIANFNGDAKETTWIYRVALNTALVWNHREKRKKPRIEFLDIREISKEDGFAELSKDQQVLDMVYDSIRQLPKLESSVLLLYLDGLSYSEMADVLGISKTNIGVRLNRAKKKLARLLKGGVDDF